MEIELEKLRELADGGDAAACLKLGLILYEGDEVPQDSKEAFKYFCKAEETGNALAAYYAGLCYYYGQGAEISDRIAHSLFEKAAKGGCEQAKQALITLSFPEHDLTLRAQAGDCEACRKLARLFRDRRFEFNDWWYGCKLEKQWYEVAASYGDPQAMLKLGDIYHYGWSIKSGDVKDERKGKKYTRLAYLSAKKALKKDSGNAYAKYWLGKCLYDGYGCRADEKKGLQLIEEAAEEGLKAAQFEIVDEYDEQDEKLGDSPRIRRILEELGEKGDAEDKRRVAVLYNSLKSCRDGERFSYWYERAAQDACAEAQFGLAEDCRNAEDYEKSKYWFERAVENGYTIARYELALYHFEGNAAKKNYAKALELLLPLARCTGGDTDLRRKGASAARFIGDIYSNGGFGVERDLKKALTWYKSSVNHGCRQEREAMQAYTRIGDAYFYGLGVEQNYAAAIGWYGKAVFDYDYEVYNDAGYVNYDYEANIKLGDCYRLGLGVEKDEKEAFRLYYDVTKHTYDYHPANERVAQCYYFGIGVEKDEEQARSYWEEAAEEGNEEAIAALKKYFPEK